MQKGAKKLMLWAEWDLKALGYEFVYLDKQIGTCRNVRAVKKEGESYKAYIQTHSEVDNSRYTVGITIEAIKGCDLHVLWMENESYMFITPCECLLDVLEETQNNGSPGYSGKNNRQWFVDFYPTATELKMKPQDKSQQGYRTRYNIEEYAFVAPQVWRSKTVNKL